MEEQKKEQDQSAAAFRKRADAFWEWFMQNESQISKMLENREEFGGDAVISFMNKGTDLITEHLFYHMGGDHEFTFTVEGNDSFFYVFPWLISRQPKQLKDKWKFYPCMQSAGGKNFSLKIYGMETNTDNVMVSLFYEKEDHTMSVRFYENEICRLDDNESYHVFYLLMENSIGEGLSRLYITQVEKADGLEADMFPLTQLEARMQECLEQDGEEVMVRPDQQYIVYEFTPKEHEELRFDVLFGTTCCSDLIDDYYQGSSDFYDSLDKLGVKAVFLTFQNDKDNTQQMLDIRNEIGDKIQEAVLGKAGSGEEIGIMLGASIGLLCCYIDLLIFDMPVFLGQIKAVLEEYPYEFYLSEFKQDGRLVKITEE